MLKLFSIGFMVILLLLPQSWVTSLMEERQVRAAEVKNEIAGKWSGEQTLTGPLLRIPFTRTTTTMQIVKGKPVEEIFKTVEYAYFLPDILTAQGHLTPHVRHRGIFDAIVYDASLYLAAQFPQPDFQKWGINDTQVHWKEASLLLGITDLRGISENPGITVGTVKLTGEPASNLGVTIQPHGSKTSEQGVIVALPWKSKQDFAEAVTLNLRLKGSERLYIVPVGKTTEVNLSGDWASPSFDGTLLPAKTPEVSESRFSADWKVLSFNRPFAQQWINDEQTLQDSSVGVRLDLPADQYQKSIRTSKYGILIIFLAFTALFLVEISGKIRVHPFQYILIGAALMIYYALLLSLSEHLGYNLAYGLAALATVVLVSLYSSTFLPTRSFILLFTSVMIGFYAFIFVIVQAEDYSLLIGSVGLFLIMAAIMYFSRHINWYRGEKR
jgi:inner membrane protein